MSDIRNLSKKNSKGRYEKSLMYYRKVGFVDKKGKKYNGRSRTTLLWKKIGENWKIISTSEKVE